MFSKLLKLIETANFKAAVKRGDLACPGCGAKPTAIPVASKDVIPCPHCATKASAFEWSAAAKPGGRAGNPDQPPANTKITRLTDPSGSVVWNIPASGKSGGLLIFGILWCSITAPLSGVFLFGEGGYKSNDGFLAQLPIILFFGVFWVVGLGFLYAGCRNKYAKHRLTANRHTISLRREFFGGVRDKSLLAERITSIAAVELYQQNYAPVHGIEIEGSQGKLRFGSALTDDEKAWLVADLRLVVLGTRASTAALPRDSARQSFFSFPLPKSSNNLWGLAIMLMLMGAGFVCVGIFVIDPPTGLPENHPPAFFRIIDGFFTRGFRIIWTLMSAAMATAGIALAVWLNKTRNCETRIEGTESEIAIRTSRHGLVLKERVFPRAAVTDIRAVVCGSSNSRTMKQMELIVGDTAEPVSRWTDGEKADELVNQVRSAL